MAIGYRISRVRAGWSGTAGAATGPWRSRTAWSAATCRAAESQGNRADQTWRDVETGQVWSARLHSLGAERLGAALRAVRDLNGPVAALALPDEPERTLEIR